MTPGRYRREVLWSILKDSVNQLRREVLRPAKLWVDDEEQWVVERIDAYLGVLAEQLPLERTQIREVDDPSFRFEQLIDEGAIRDAVWEFLTWLTKEGIERGVIGPEADRLADEDVTTIAQWAASRWRQTRFN